MKVLCVFGQFQYGDPTRGTGTEYGAFIPALKRLGHEVHHFESWGARHDLKAMNFSLLETVARLNPDVVIVVPMEYEIWIETFLRIASMTDSALVCWCTDDSWKYREVSRYLGRCFHAMVTTYQDVVEKYRADGFEHVLVSQWAASKLNSPLAAADCDYSVTFVGAAHGDRYKVIEKLRSLGVDVQCFGHGWDSGAVTESRVAEIMRRSVISLNFANSRGDNQVKARIFEVTGAGGFLLTDDAPGIDRFFEVGEEIAVFSSTADLAEKIRYYLNHPDQRDRIALAGFRRTSMEHTYSERMRRLLEFAVAAKNAHSLPTMSEDDYRRCAARYRLGTVLRMIRGVLVGVLVPIFGPERGRRAARRLSFEISWRVAGARTFTAAGLPGRMFPGI